MNNKNSQLCLIKRNAKNWKKAAQLKTVTEIVYYTMKGSQNRET